MLFDLVLQVGKHGEEEIPLQKLILVLKTGPFNEFSDSAEALCDSVVIFDVD